MRNASGGLPLRQQIVTTYCISISFLEIMLMVITLVTSYLDWGCLMLKSETPRHFCRSVLGVRSAACHWEALSARLAGQGARWQDLLCLRPGSRRTLADFRDRHEMPGSS